MTRSSRLLWLVAVLLVAMLSAPLFCKAAEAPPADRTSASREIATAEVHSKTKPVAAVLFAPSRPVFIQLLIEVDGAGLEAFREAFATRWFTRLDKDNNGTINEAEANEFPATTENNSTSPQSKPWADLDSAPTDGQATPAEFHAFLVRRLGLPLTLAESKVSDDKAASLFDRIDLNHDGALSADELSAARETLFPLDADDDETVSVAELTAAQQARSASSASSAEAQRLPLALVSHGISPDEIAAQLLQVYDARHEPPADRALDTRELGRTPESLETFDADGNGKLDEQELSRLVAEAPPDTTLRVHLFSQQRGLAKVIAESTTAPEFDWKPATDGISAVLGAFQISMIAKRTRSSAGDSRGYYAVRFRIVDRDRNNYLDEEEFAKLELADAEFGSVDIDGNKQIAAEELTEFIGRREMAPLNQVVVEVADESRSLFDRLDTRKDSRLSPRELMSARDQLAEIGSNKDGRITPGELTTKLSIEFGVKRPAVDRGGMMAAPPRNSGRPTAVSRDRGPEWFLRMDRNYDGDVSFREFLGTRAAFEKLDTDHDELLSPDEAEKAR